MKTQSDIVIVGGGMVGAALALALSQKTNWRITLVERKERGFGESEEGIDQAVGQSAIGIIDSRVVALNHASIQWLEALEVWQSIDPAHSFAYRHMHVWDAGGTGSLDFDAADSQASSLGSIVENTHLTNTLWQALRNSRVDVFAGDSVAAIRYDKALQIHTLSFESGVELTASLVVAADGAQSPLRNMMGIIPREKAYQQGALVATVQTQKPHQSTAWQCFGEAGPLAFLPLPSVPGSSGDAHYCAVVWSQDDAVAGELMALDDTQFMQQLARAFEYRLGEVLAVYHRASVPLVQRHADVYIQPGFALVGDAAHTIHPLAGQGVNLGFADVKVLCDEVNRAEQRGLPLTEPSILSRYQRQRRGHNAAAVYGMDGIKRLFEAKSPAAVVLRNQGMEIFNRWRGLKNQAIKLAQGSL